MKRLAASIYRRIRTHFPKLLVMEGQDGGVAFFGNIERPASISGFFCGPDSVCIEDRALSKSALAERFVKTVSEGRPVIVSDRVWSAISTDYPHSSIEVLLRIALRKSIPENHAVLMDSIRNSTTKEDLRRIRKAEFTYRVTRDPEDISLFHKDYYVPSVKKHFPNDGQIMSLSRMQQALKNGGELVCADIGDEWVAGLFIMSSKNNYEMGGMGIHLANDTYRQLRVVSALLVGSMQYAVERKCKTATLGYSLPFLGKGPIWFKAKWGCDLEFSQSGDVVHLLLDLRQESVRHTLTHSPIVHRHEGQMVASAWLEESDVCRSTLFREIERMKSIKMWYIFGEKAAISNAGQLNELENVSLTDCDLASPEPIWLGSLIQ